MYLIFFNENDANATILNFASHLTITTDCQIRIEVTNGNVNIYKDNIFAISRTTSTNLTQEVYVKFQSNSYLDPINYSNFIITSL